MRNWSNFCPKNPEKSLKFGSKTKLNAKEERSLLVWGVLWQVEYGDVGHGVGCGDVMGCAICMMTCSGYSNMCDTFDRASHPLLIGLGPFCDPLSKHYLTLFHTHIHPNDQTRLTSKLNPSPYNSPLPSRLNAKLE